MITHSIFIHEPTRYLPSEAHPADERVASGSMREGAINVEQPSSVAQAFRSSVCKGPVGEKNFSLLSQDIWCLRNI